MTTITPEMMPCPFCDSPNVSMSYSATMQSPEPHARFVECDDCAASGPAHDVMGDDAGAMAGAITAWNTRTDRLSGKLEAEREIVALRAAAADALAGWRYIRERHGDLYGVGWDRVETALADAIGANQEQGAS